MKLEKREKPYPLSLRSKTNLKGVNVWLAALVSEMLYYIDISVIEGLRTPERQAYLKKTGATQTLKSKHLDGLAIDLYPFPVPRNSSGEIDSSSKKWDEMALVAYYCAGKLGIPNLEWGGTWKSLVDKPHFQLS